MSLSVYRDGLTAYMVMLGVWWSESVYVEVGDTTSRRVNGITTFQNENTIDDAQILLSYIACRCSNKATV